MLAKLLGALFLLAVLAILGLALVGEIHSIVGVQP